MAQGRPIKRSAFESVLASFEEAESYRAWVFGLPLARETSQRPANENVN